MRLYRQNGWMRTSNAEAPRPCQPVYSNNYLHETGDYHIIGVFRIRITASLYDIPRITRPHYSLTWRRHPAAIYFTACRSHLEHAWSTNAMPSTINNDDWDLPRLKASIGFEVRSRPKIRTSILQAACWCFHFAGRLPILVVRWPRYRQVVVARLVHQLYNLLILDGRILRRQVLSVWGRVTWSCLCSC